MVRGGGRAGRGRGRGRGLPANNEIDGQTASVTESTQNNGQASGRSVASPVQGIDPVALRNIVMDSLREILGQGQLQVPPARQEPLAQAVRQQPLPPPPPVHELRQDYWRILKLMRDFGTVSYSGGTDPIAADNWRKQLERNFGSVRCPPGYQVDIASSFLLDEAQVWWEGIESENPPGNVITWATFREEFIRKYFPQETMNELRMEFLNLRQDNRTVREYEREFSRLRRFGVGAMDEQTLIQKFMMGLRLDIRKICQIRGYGSLIELVEKASLTEKTNEAESKLVKNASQRTTRAPDPPMQQQHGNQGRVQVNQLCGRCGKNHFGRCLYKAGVCYKCGKSGHHQLDCKAFAGTCHTCGKYGHRAKECRVRTGGPDQPNQVREQLPPPPKRTTIAPRAYVVGDHEGAEPIAGTLKFKNSLSFMFM